MGADGSVYYLRKEDFTSEFPDVKPEDIQLWERDIFGTILLWAYADTNYAEWPNEYSKAHPARCLERHRSRLERVKAEGTKGVWKSGGNLYQMTIVAKDEQEAIDRLEADPTLEYSTRCMEAEEWFQKNAEDWMVWT